MTSHSDSATTPHLEEQGINVENEGSLHAQVKAWYAEPGDRLEVRVDPYIIDIVRDDLLIEVQTSGFTAIRDKLRDLVAEHRVRLVYPIACNKRLVYVDPDDGHVVRRRKSPKHGTVLDVFDELVRMPRLLQQEAFELEVLLIEEDEIRCDDGEGSWRRKGVSIRDHRLVDVVERRRFACPDDLCALLPEALEGPFTNGDLAKALGIPKRQARRMTYCLRKMEALALVGKKGNWHLHEVMDGGG